MAVPEDTRHKLSRWCAARVPKSERARRQVSYTIHGDEVVILDRRAPTYPELNTAWSATPVAQLRREGTHGGRWQLYRPRRGSREWERAGAPDTDPLALLERLGAD